MIKENQKLLNRLHVLSDGAILYLSLPVAFWIRFYILPGGYISVELYQYLLLGILLTLVQLFIYAAFGLYQSFRRGRLRQELERLWLANLLVMAALLSFLFVQHYIDYSRLTLIIWFFLSTGLLSVKRAVLRRVLHYFRQKGYNQKHVLLIGGGEMARTYWNTVDKDRELGYTVIGYVSSQREKRMGKRKRLGGYEALESLLESKRPDEAVCAITPEDYGRMPEIIEACEKTGTKLSIIPSYAKYMPSNPQFDEVGGIPMLNFRRIPLDNWANAFCKRAMDIMGSLLLILLSSPVMLVCVIGVRLSSPGPIIFKQERVGRNKKRFFMYKFRSMRVNSGQDTQWSTDHDSRKTKFGAFMRKCSLDELPQFFNVLKGEMSLVGPRPEIPYYVEQFKQEVPLYMVKHQVRPGITGWAQVNGLRGDTSIKARVEHDVYYIEHWSLLFDIEILLTTVFRGKFMNSEALD
ncbi:MAG: undecaprenyl-phosphate glucose phosphotransferase [Oscillibacter sp.]|nr:undecaprenyl-phosphate glucose phosphotransferase [Oscillibacter sp.]